MPDANTSPATVAARQSIERQNRATFRACLEALGRPGRPQRLSPLFGSCLLAVASALLADRIRYFYEGEHTDFRLVEIMTGAQAAEPADSDYLFADGPRLRLLDLASPGTMEAPETSATCIFNCSTAQRTGVILRGPGIHERLRLDLPLSRPMVDGLISKRHIFPLGIDLFFLDSDGWIIGLPRTTGIEVAS